MVEDVVMTGTARAGVTRMTPSGAAAVASTRRAVRRLLTDPATGTLLSAGELAVAVSGGADSLALAAAAQHVASRMGLTVHGLIVDHGLQPGSARVAARAASQLEQLGLPQVRVLPVTVAGPGGPEGAARRARYTALGQALPVPGGLVLLGHTRDDQAETVLLGLGRGSGPRSLAGMRALDPPWARPFLDVPRATTRDAVAALGLIPWEDPHNADARYTRVRLRHEVLPALEEILQGGVAGALARTAAQLREDTDALDALASDLGRQARDGGELVVDVLRPAPAALRRRVLRGWLLDSGVPELSDAQLRRADGLIESWHGQGGVWLPGGFEVSRVHGRLRVTAGQS